MPNSGAVAEETSSTSTRFLITNLISLQFTLFFICLSFSSSPLHKILPFYSPSFSFVVFLAMADPKRAKGFLPSFNALDSPSVLSKLIHNDAMEGLTRVAKENLNNFDERTIPEVFVIYLINL